MTTVHEPTVPPAEDTPLPGRDRRLLLGAALPPLAWSSHLLVAYGLVYPSLRLKTKAWLVALTIVCLCTSLLGSVLAFSARRARDDEEDAGPAGSAPARARQSAGRDPSARIERSKVVGEGAALMGLFFAAVILAQGFPIVAFGLEDP